MPFVVFSRCQCIRTLLGLPVGCSESSARAWKCGTRPGILCQCLFALRDTLPFCIKKTHLAPISSDGVQRMPKLNLNLKSCPGRGCASCPPRGCRPGKATVILAYHSGRLNVARDRLEVQVLGADDIQARARIPTVGYNVYMAGIDAAVYYLRYEMNQMTF